LHLIGVPNPFQPDEPRRHLKIIPFEVLGIVSDIGNWPLGRFYLDGWNFLTLFAKGEAILSTHPKS